ncbi:hypothetical protein [Alkalihalobacillus trypoxylicola]|uniref:Uncharacterized protein n=1 Tax=Alkalihalobacillus trypoxylicola TaxID=519424 RepID=A0A161Q1X3_9BACI|nr:hypothetical protein [Alkalihalobacillus trypoxylicola]KYG34941.1 hypothetical protein AZF04_01000 [Alkalihalobacillus trypoxylicola]
MKKITGQDKMMILVAFLTLGLMLLPILQVDKSSTIENEPLITFEDDQEERILSKSEYDQLVEKEKSMTSFSQ